MQFYLILFILFFLNNQSGDKVFPFIFITAQWKNVRSFYDEDKQFQMDQNIKYGAGIDQNMMQSIHKEEQPDLLNQQNRGQYEMKSDDNLFIKNNATRVEKKYQTDKSPLQKVNTLSLDDFQQDDIDSDFQLVDNQKTNQQFIQWMNNLSIYMDHFEIRLDQQIISTIQSLITQLSKVIYSDSKNKSQPISEVTENLLSVNIEKTLIDSFSKGSNNKRKAIYFKNLSIQPINCCITLNLSGSINDISSGVEDILYVPLAIFQEFGLELVAFDQANISLSALNQQHLYDTLPSIISRIQKHYINQILTELYKIFGSFEAIGNPVKLVKDISTGVSQMIYNPLRSLAKGNSVQAVSDLTSGAISLVSKSISGAYKAVRNITGFVMRIVAKITLHNQYLQDRSIRINRQIKNIQDGFLIGGKNLVLVLWDTVYGVIYIPLQGLKNHHVFGLIKGIYTALVSLFIKPTVGIYDFLISIFDGLVNSTLYEEHIMENRSRPPRIFENQKIINFDYKRDVGKEILRRLKQQPKGYEEIKYYDQIQVSKKKFIEIILTNVRLVVAQKNSSYHFKKVKLHKVKYIEYYQRGKYFKFYHDIPQKKLMRFLYPKLTQTKIKYEKFDHQQKASEMIRYLQEHYKQQKIPIKIIIKNE